MFPTDPTTERNHDGDRNAEPITVKISPREAAQIIDDSALPCDTGELHPPGLCVRPPFRLGVSPSLPEAALIA